MIQYSTALLMSMFAHSFTSQLCMRRPRTKREPVLYIDIHEFARHVPHFLRLWQAEWLNVPAFCAGFDGEGQMAFNVDVRANVAEVRLNTREVGWVQGRSVWGVWGGVSSQ
jgi:hypothetical protein